MKVTATNLESFRLYLERDFITTAEIEARIRGEEVEQTPAMLLGAAFDELVLRDKPLEAAPGLLVDYGGFSFDTETARDTQILGALYQVTEIEVVKLHGRQYRLAGRIDAIRDNIIYDLKTRNGPHRIEQYPDSLQWPFYCYLFGVSRFTFRLVSLKEDHDGVWYVSDCQDLPLVYGAAERVRLERWLGEFAMFCDSRGLVPGSARKKRKRRVA